MTDKRRPHRSRAGWKEALRGEFDKALHGNSWARVHAPGKKPQQAIFPARSFNALGSFPPLEERQVVIIGRDHHG